jgi:hypothetical protein
MYSKISNMEKTHPGVEALRQILKDETERFGKESHGHKVLHRKYQKTIIILTSVTTVVAGAGLVVPQYADSFIQFVVLGLTASTAAISSWSELRRARELWQHERDIFYKLLDIQRELEFISSTRELKISEVDDYFNRINHVLGSSTEKWSAIVEKKNP